MGNNISFRIGREFAIISFCCCVSFSCGQCDATIDGPTFLIPDLNGDATGQWTLKPGQNSVSSEVWSFKGNNITHISTGKIKLNTSNPSCVTDVEVKYVDATNNVPCSLVKQVQLLPNISAGPTNGILFPDEIIQIPLINPCIGFPVLSNCGMDFFWAASSNCCTSFHNFHFLPVHIPPNPSQVPGSLKISCSLFASWPCNPNLGLVAKLTERTFQVKLRNPKITGNTSSIGCPGSPSSNVINLSASNIAGNGLIKGAAYYDWSFSWNPNEYQVSGQGSPNISLTVLKAGILTVQVRALTDAPSVAAAKSDMSAPFNINVCCLPFVTVSGAVTAGNVETGQAAIKMDLANIVASGAQGMYHAGSEVLMIPGFEAHAGSYFHAYIRACDSQFAKIRNPENTDSENQYVEPEVMNSIPADTTFNRTTAENLYAPLSCKIFPNPSTGRFELSFPGEVSKISDFSVKDLLGNYVPFKIEKGERHIKVEVFDCMPGIYICHFTFANRDYSKKLVLLN